MTLQAQIRHHQSRTGRPKRTAGSKLHDTAAEAGEGVEGRQVPGLPVAPPAGRCRSTVHSRCTPPWGGNDMGSVRRTVLPNRTRPSTITADVQPTSHFRIADLQCELAWSPSCVVTAWRAVPDGLSPVRRQGLCSTPCGPSPCPKPGPIRSPCVSNCRDSQGTARASGRQEHAVRRRGLCHVG